MAAVDPCLIPFEGHGARVAGIAATPFAFALPALQQLVRIPVYRRTDARPTGLSDYLCHENDVPPALKCRPYYSLSTDAGVFIPLESLVVSLYEGHLPSRPLTEFLADFRACLLTAAAPAVDGTRPRAAFRPEVTELGFYLVSLRHYGRRLTAYVGWICPCDRLALELAPYFAAGALEFRPRPDRTLDPGRWISAATTPVAALLRERLTSAFPGAPIQLLSEAGREHLLASFRWTPLALMTKNQARQARVQFVRQHPELMDRPRDLAQAMCQAQLYSPTCNPHEVARYMGSLILEARQADSAQGGI